MIIKDEIVKLRKTNGFTQEQLAEKLDVSRQAVAKWEAGESVPEVEKIILISNFFGVTIDSLLKRNDSCSNSRNTRYDNREVREFLCRAKKETYANDSGVVKSSRTNSVDLKYSEGNFSYLDTYLGSEKFSGEEAVWLDETPIWSMNYVGRVLNNSFSGDFLKEVLSKVDVDLPYRGPRCYHRGEYSYFCHVDGDFNWFNGYEEIFFKNKKVYECYFHGGELK